jgi:hypothetical protein
MENGNGITKADLKAALAELKKDIVDELTGKMQTMNDNLTEKMRQIETNLLTEFHRYGKGQQLRLLHLESRRPPTV